ncbi:hypothetical protein QUA56_07195 [Microcoleus sp. N3A4]|uniref:terpene synthase family protein n=1 Tax=Microcoleus sp. N3A4 TaxID=3055379 RepID=UPI002FD7318C
MLEIKYPDLYCPFPSARNQYADAAGQHTIEWVRFFNFFPDESAYQILCAANFQELAALTHPHASLEALEIFNDFLVWGFIADDQFEEAGTSKQLERLELEHARLVDILKGASLTDSDTPAALTLQDIWQRLHQFLNATPELMLRFARDMEEGLQAVRWEALNHTQGITPNLVTYMKMRALQIGVYAYFDFIQIVDRIALPPEVIELPIVKRLELAANNVFAWANDIFSVEKEIREGQTHNLVLILQHEYQIPFLEAIERAAEIHDAEVRTFIELSAQLPSFGAEVDAELQRYISGLRSWMRGCLDWYLETGRY